MKNSELADLDATAVAELIQLNQITPTEALEATLDLIETRDAQVSAVWNVLADRAVKSIKNGLPNGPFRGVPFAVKDLGLKIEGEVTTHGSAYFQGDISSYSSELTKRYESAGLVICAKVSTSEFGLGPSGDTDLHPRTNNPWDITRIAGGSSTGSAAVVSSGIFAMAHASDGGGSIRIPASSLERWYLDPQAQRLALARPLPQKPYRQALRGTLFHRFVEEHFETKPRVTFAGLEEDDGDRLLGFEDWVAAFTGSPFASQVPLAIEQELHVPLAGRIVICKIDAVFSSASGPHIVDWKTGAMPTDPEDIRAKSLQLAAYRAAWAQWSGVDEPSITASFWYVGTSTLLTPERLASTEELERTLSSLWSD
jgi:hypothetical protein